MKPILILYLRALAALLDLIGRKHSLRRRIGALTRKPRQKAPEVVEQA